MDKGRDKKFQDILTMIISGKEWAGHSMRTTDNKTQTFRLTSLEKKGKKCQGRQKTKPREGMKKILRERMDHIKFRGVENARKGLYHAEDRQCMVMRRVRCH